MIRLTDSIINPYAPGAGEPPQTLTGRDELSAMANVAIARKKAGRAAQGLICIGLRGVGKSVLLEQIRQLGKAHQVNCLHLEAPEHQSLPAMLIPQLRIALLELSRNEQAKALAIRGLKAIAGFVSALSVTFGDIQVGVDFEPEPGLADNGDLNADLTALIESAGEAAQAAGSALLILIDELQYVAEAQLAALLAALHRANQRRLPVILIGAGLLSLREKAGEAKTHAERLFAYRELGPLDRTAATLALCQLAAELGVEFAPEAIDYLLEITGGYPYFIQAWGFQVWEEAQVSPISLADAKQATTLALAKLDEGFFRVRMDRLTEREKAYLFAMARLGDGIHTTGEINTQLGTTPSASSSIRNQLIEKGMIWSPQYGKLAFIVPMFADFIQRNYPCSTSK
ncbi:AAA family ATPase [Ferrimonas senticii]|uniref:AAA family ATPase n=1 Tax=Ferrimonas senticii TaxID=394566 RepID=UPI0004841076|nr:AAA family ATPase [Ferrimonas senticii]